MARSEGSRHESGRITCTVRPVQSPGARRYSHSVPKREAVILALLAVAALAPIWGHTYVATQDGPSHLYNTSILLHWNDPGSLFPRVFERHLAPIPNWLGTAALY